MDHVHGNRRGRVAGDPLQQVGRVGAGEATDPADIAMDLERERGITIKARSVTLDYKAQNGRTYQLNFGGNTDFLNMLERERLESKKISKTNAVTSMMDYEIDEDDIHVGPSDYVPWLKDRKWCHIRMEGTTYGDVPLNLELKLEVWDSPNSAGVITDAIRCLKIGHQFTNSHTRPGYRTCRRCRMRRLDVRGLEESGANDGTRTRYV